MGAKRGSSGLSLVVAVDKPSGMSSHDVVNRCRRIFGERRVGHTGTLDPLATGVLPICIGPATRLDKYLTGHDKRYRVTMELGTETTTDDCCGQPTESGEVTGDLLDGDFAAAYVAGLVGEHEQVPPQYSAVKQAGKRAYELARAGKGIELEPRRIEVYEAELISRYREDRAIRWVVDFSVSKGTYIRALVRDMGRELGCRAHVAALQRRVCGAVLLEECVSLESLESLGVQAAVDPVRLLGFRMAFADDFEKAVESGGFLRESDVKLFEFGLFDGELAHCACTSSIERSCAEAHDGELVSVVLANRLKAVYRFDAQAQLYKPDCVFSTPVMRGSIGTS